MTEQEFYKYIQTTSGQTEYYEWLYDNFPELDKHALFGALENGDHIESFMEYLGVEQ